MAENIKCVVLVTVGCLRVYVLTDQTRIPMPVDHALRVCASYRLAHETEATDGAIQPLTEDLVGMGADLVMESPPRTRRLGSSCGMSQGPPILQKTLAQRDVQDIGTDFIHLQRQTSICMRPQSTAHDDTASRTRSSCSVANSEAVGWNLRNLCVA